MKKHNANSTMKKQSVQGATLLEVLVSVFLLTFGILGLMAAQLRSVGAVSESENRAIAAQAAENLVEAMQVNPRLLDDRKRDYSDYLTGLTSVSAPETCEKGATITATSKDACALGSGAITKKELAQAQLGEFQYILSQMPNTVDLKYAICIDEVSSLEKETANINDAQCSGSTKTSKPVIKVIWSVRENVKETTTGIPETTAQSYYMILPE